MSLPQLLSRKEVARRLAVTVKTVERWTAAGKFPRPILLQGTEPRWPEVVVEAWLWQQAQQPPGK